MRHPTRVLEAGVTPTRRFAATSPLKGEVKEVTGDFTSSRGGEGHYQPPPPPPPPPPPEKPPPEKPDDEEDVGCGRVEDMVEAMEEEKPPMRSPKLLKPPP